MVLPLVISATTVGTIQSFGVSKASPKTPAISARKPVIASKMAGAG